MKPCQIVRNKYFSITSLFIGLSLVVIAMVAGLKAGTLLGSRASRPDSRSLPADRLKTQGVSSGRKLRTETQPAPAFGAGSIVYVDPATGWIGQPPPNVVTQLLGSNAAFSSSSSGLVESNSPVSGRMVYLQGRFQNALLGTMGPDGRFSTSCQEKSAADTGGGSSTAAPK
jgi:hypothetical protein